MIKIIKMFQDGKTVSDDVDPMDLPIVESFNSSFEAMIANKCHTQIIETEYGNVMYTVKEDVKIE